MTERTEQPDAPPATGTPARTLDDESIAGRITEVVRQRDALQTLAGEMLATLLMERNAGRVDPDLREIAGLAWQPQFLAIEQDRPLSDAEVSAALAASGIEVTDAIRRVRAAVAYAKSDEADDGISDAEIEESISLIRRAEQQQPAPVAAGGAGRGERRWAILSEPGDFVGDFHKNRWDADYACKHFTHANGARVVPVLVTVLADDAGEPR